MALTKSISREVTLKGTTDILFDPYAGDNKAKLSVEQKLYKTANNEVFLPSLNIVSLLSSINTMSAPKMFVGKGWRAVADAMAAVVSITPNKILFRRNDKPIIFGQFEEQPNGDIIDPKSGIQVVRHVARLDKGIPNPKERPMLSLDWALKFQLNVAPHPELSETMIEDLFTKGGQFIGLGTFRKVYGKFDFNW